MTKLQGKKKAILGLAIVTALLNTAYVEEALAAESVQTRDVMVTASRTEQEVKEAPAASEVITSKDIEKMGAESLAQALQLATGINVLENGMVGNAVSLRGMKTNQTLLLIDGRRIRTENTDQTANAYELQRIDMNNVERIEIVRGAASSLYGADAMGGVINIITKNHDEAWGKVSLDMTTRQSDQGFQLSTGKIGKWSFGGGFRHTKVRRLTTNTSSSYDATGLPFSYINGAAVTSATPGAHFNPFMGYYVLGDYHKVAQKETTNQYGDKYYFNFDAKYDIDDKNNLKFFVDYMKEDLQQNELTHSLYTFDTPVLSPMFGGGTPITSYETGAPVPSTTKYDHKRYTTGVEYNGEDDRGDHTLRFSYTDFTKDQNTYDGTTGALKDFDTMKFKTYTLEGRRTQQANDNHLLTYGGEYRVEKYDSTRTGQWTSMLDKKAENHTMKYSAVYLQDEWVADDKWLIIPSVRLDYNDVFGSKATYKIGTNYKMSDEARFKFNIGTSYRAPTASELYMNWKHNPVGNINVEVYGNPNLSPENAFNLDFGFEAENGKTSAKATYFINKVSNLIDLDVTETSSMGSTIYKSYYTNVDRVTIQGVELEAEQQLGNGFSLRGIYNYLDARNDKTDAQLTGRARHKVALQLNYEDDNGWSGTLWNDWMAGYGYSDNSSRKEAAASVLNLVVNKKLGKSMDVYFGCNNILDSKNTALNYDGRIWRAGMNFNF